MSITPSPIPPLPAAVAEVGWLCDRWFNGEAVTLADLHGRVVVLHTFQMLCPACVNLSVPLMQETAQVFAKEDVSIIGLHTVFEHHAVMGADALDVFLHEYRITYPVGIDRPSPAHGTPQTMAAWQLRGTPSYLVFDREGQPVLNRFGRLSAMELGAVIGHALRQPSPVTAVLQSGAAARAEPHQAACNDSGCTLS